nr:restriction endonuclease subunit S [uncultured Prevotella sp.]
MKYIDELLQGHEVVWKPLGEVFSLVTDFTAAGSFASNAANVQYRQEKSFAQLVRTTDLKSRFKNTDKFIYVDEHAFEYLWRVNLNEECLVLSNVGNCGEIYHIMPDSLPYANSVLGPNALLLRTTIGMNKFFYYWFLCNSFQCELGKITSKTGQTKFNKTNLKKILIPLPPLSVQKEIVRILDKFTTLEAELDCRKRQYEYYRNQLLSFDMLNRGEQRLNNVKWMTIKKISKNISSGGTPRSNITAYYGGDIPWLRTQEVNFSDIWDTDVKITKEGMDASSAKYIPANCVIIAMYGATVGRVGINKIPLTTNQACANIEVNEDIALYRYVFHYLSSQYEYIKSLGAGSQTNINSRIIKELRIPIPPLSEQQRIVSILDKFDTLTTSISEGLPKEIELRRKQYEYYRERLLSFRH